MDNPLEYIKQYVGGPTSDDYVDTMYRYAQLVPRDGIIIDIGTCEGRTAFAFALGSLKSVKVYTIDPTPNPRFEEHRKALGLEDKIEIIKQKSQDVDWKLPIDMMFDDGLHTYQGVKEDIEKYCPFVKKDHWIIFDDYTNYQNTIGRAIDEFGPKYFKLDHLRNFMYFAKKL